MLERPGATLGLDLDVAAAQFRAVLESHERIWVTVHESPDGDSIGAALALQAVLEARGKRVIAIRQHPFPRQYENLPGAKRMGDAQRLGELFAPEVIIAVDLGSFERINAVLDFIRPETPVINIDHHRDNEGPARPCRLLQLVDPRYASTTMLTYLLLERAWPGCVGAEAAQCLYIGLITDTGCFRFTNTNAETLRVGSELAALGADPGTLAEDYMFRRRPQSVRLLADVLGSLEMFGGGRLATLRLTRKMLEATGARMDETEGFVNYATSMEGVRVAALLRELDPGRTRVSLRSSGFVDVARVATEFGGGGHPNAAGLTLASSIEEAQKVIVATLLPHLQE